jgi:hypothetical protein
MLFHGVTHFRIAAENSTQTQRRPDFDPDQRTRRRTLPNRKKLIEAALPRELYAPPHDESARTGRQVVTQPAGSARTASEGGEE